MNMPAEGFNQGSQGLTPDNRGSVTKGNGAAKVVTMAAIAHSVGVSQGAVSSLLNDRDYGIRVSPKTRERVFKTCRDLGYIPNDLRAFVRIYPELGETCLLVSNKIPRGLENPFIARLAARVMAHASRQPTSIGVVLYDEAREYHADSDLPSPIKNGTASRILCVGAANESMSKVMHERSLPSILIGHSSQMPGTTSIVPDYMTAAREALRLLMREGHRQVGVIGGPFGDREPRLAEMSHAVAVVADEIELTIEPENVFHGKLDFEAGVAAVNSMLAHSSRPTALLCMTEASAIGALAAAHCRGIHVPDELSVITFADHAGTLDSCIPLTAVVLPVDEIAAAAVREADRQLHEGVPATATKIVIPVQLIERGTCGPIKAPGGSCHTAPLAGSPA